MYPRRSEAVCVAGPSPTDQTTSLHNSHKSLMIYARCALRVLKVFKDKQGDLVYANSNVPVNIGGYECWSIIRSCIHKVGMSEKDVQCTRTFIRHSKDIGITRNTTLKELEGNSKINSQDSVEFVKDVEKSFPDFISEVCRYIASNRVPKCVAYTSAPQKAK